MSEFLLILGLAIDDGDSLPHTLGMLNMALAVAFGMGVRLTDGLPMWYSAAWGDPKTTVFLEYDPGTLRLDEDRMLRGIEMSASAGDGSTLRVPPAPSREDSFSVSSEPSNSFMSVVLAVEALLMDSASDIELLLLRFTLEEMLDCIVISDIRPV
jgi:hypothetical protein